LVTNIATWNAAAAKKDASTIAGLYTVDAIRVTADAPVYGRAAIEKNYAEGLKAFTEVTVKADKVEVLDSGAVLVSGMWTGSVQGNKGPVAMRGYWGNALVRDGGAWKASLDVYNINMPPAGGQ